MRVSDQHTSAALAVLTGAALIGLSPILVRLSELGPQATNFWRFALAAPILLILAGRFAPRPDRRSAGLLIVAGIFFGADIALWAAALSFTTVANATLLSNMTPIFAVLAGWIFFREKLHPAMAMGGAVALCGAVLLALGRADPATEVPNAGWFGDGLGLFSALWYAGYLIILRALGPSVSLAWTMTLVTISAALFVAIAALALGESFLPHSASGWLVLLGLAAPVQICGQGLIAYGVARLPLTASTVLLWLQPVSAALISLVLFSEALGPLALTGGALILGGVWFVQKQRAT